MTYPKEFEEWLKTLQGEASSFDLNESHFWLSAFAKLVQEEALKECREHTHTQKIACSYSIGSALQKLSERFGLEREG